MRILFFDLETTGTDIKNDRIVQISTVLYSCEHFGYFSEVNILEKKCMYINPSIEIPESASKVHGIYAKDVETAPLFKNVAKSILKYFTQEDLILAGYNILNYDIPLIISEFGRCGLTFAPNKEHIIDCCRVFKHKEERTLSKALQFYCNEEHTEAHDALSDNVATAKVMIGQMSMYNLTLLEMNDISVKNQVDYSGNLIMQDGVICFSFGKNRGKAVSECKDYAKWMLNNDFPDDTKIIIKSILSFESDSKG